MRTILWPVRSLGDPSIPAEQRSQNKADAYQAANSKGAAKEYPHKKGKGPVRVSAVRDSKPEVDEMTANVQAPTELMTRGLKSAKYV